MDSQNQDRRRNDGAAINSVTTVQAWEQLDEATKKMDVRPTDTKTKKLNSSSASPVDYNRKNDRKKLAKKPLFGRHL